MADKFPPDLYKYRFFHGIVRYVHVEGDIYQDTTCLDHEPCRVRVKPEGDHFVVVAPANESAATYLSFHETQKGDTDLYPDKDSVLRITFRRKEDEYRRQLEKVSAMAADEEAGVAGLSLEDFPPQTVASLDFGDTVLLLYGSGIIETVSVEMKVYSRDGLAYLLGDNDERICDGGEGSPLDVTVRVDDYEGFSEHTMKGFSSRKALDAFLHNKAVSKKREELESLRRQADDLRERIRKMEQGRRELEP